MSASDAIQRLNATVNGEGMRIGVVVAQFNDHITGKLLDGALETLKKNGVSENDIQVVTVPGAFELPLAAKWLVESQKIDAVITLGAVIRGDTPHFEYVCTEAARGVQQVQLETGKPVVFGVLTTDTEAQAIARTDAAQAGNKGVDCALTALAMVDLRRQLVGA